MKFPYPYLVVRPGSERHQCWLDSTGQDWLPIVGEKVEIPTGGGRTAPGWAVLLWALPSAAIDRLVGTIAEQLGMPRDEARDHLFEEGYATLEGADVALCATVEDGRAHWANVAGAQMQGRGGTR